MTVDNMIAKDRPRPSSVYSGLLVLFLVCLKCTYLTYANISGELCGADGYNIQNLIKATYWYYEPADVESCPADAISCRYSFTVCKRLPSGFNCDDCSMALSVNGTNEYENTGSYDPNTNPISSTPGDTTFSILYTSGDIGSVLVFNCDLNVKWILGSGGVSQVPEAAKTEVQYSEENSLYTFSFYSAEACYVPPTVIPIYPHDGLSAGSILLLIFFPTLAIYFILGIILNKLGGANGKELIPNYEFWHSLPGLIADGVVFSWSMVTCQGSKGVSGYDSI